MIEVILLILLSLAVIILSGIVSSSEVAIISISYPKVKEILTGAKTKKDQKKAEALLRIKENIKKYITTIVVLNNIINIIGSIYIGVIASEIFGEIYLGIISGILTFLIIVFSEIIPKVLGEKYASSYSRLIAGPLIIVTNILSPVLYLFDKFIHLFIKEESNYHHVSEGIIKEMAVLGKQEGSIDAYESELIENIFEMDDTEAYQIMVPKNKVQLLDHDSNYERIVKILRRTGFTRFPVSKKDEIIGLVNAKDLFKFHKREEEFNIDEVLRPIEFVPETMKIITLEQKLRRNKVHMAAIVNEHGDFTGIVTLEDVFEELLGEIEDEFDLEEELFKKLDTKSYEIDASIDIEEFNENFPENIPTELDFITLNGYIINRLGFIPTKGEKLVMDKGIFEILSTNRKRVLKVKYTMND